MNKYNKYGFVSGGATFDAMDRYALRQLNAEYPETDHENWFTASAEVCFNKQICPDTKVVYSADIERRGDIAYIDVSAKDCDSGIELATICFTFKKAHHNYCEIKGQNNG